MIIDIIEEMMIEIDTKIITLMIFEKDDIEIKLQLSNVIYALNMSLNLFLLMMIYDRSYKT